MTHRYRYESTVTDSLDIGLYCDGVFLHNSFMLFFFHYLKIDKYRIEMFCMQNIKFIIRNLNRKIWREKNIMSTNTNSGCIDVFYSLRWCNSFFLFFEYLKFKSRMFGILCFVFHSIFVCLFSRPTMEE